MDSSRSLFGTIVQNVYASFEVSDAVIAATIRPTISVPPTGG
jgi:hypothetical protein